MSRSNFLTRLQNVLDPRWRERNGRNPAMLRCVRVPHRDLDELIRQFIRLDDAARLVYDSKRLDANISEEATVIERIHALWHLMPDDAERSNVVAMLDPRSFYDAKIDAHRDSLLTTIGFQMIRPRPDLGLVDDHSSPSEPDKSTEPRLVTLRYITSNRRTAYLDDPHNSKEFE